jgi:hypothetical protein
MTKLKKSSIPQEEVEYQVKAQAEAYRRGDPMLRQCFGVNHPNIVPAIREYIERLNKEHTTWLNELYQVAVREVDAPESWGGKMLHLSIKRRDRRPVHDWRDLQAIKNQLVGPECEGIELYPAESRVVDTSNQYHIWVLPDSKFRFPFGFETGLKSETELGGSKQRKFTT